MAFDPSRIPIDAKFSYQKKTIKKIDDPKSFSPCTSKIEDVGRLKRRKFFIECKGNGEFEFTELNSAIQNIKKLNELKEKGIISKKEFEKKKKQLLKKIN